MIAYEKTVKVSAKGQITLPKAVRQKLATALVRVVIDDDAVRIEPVPDVGGSLRQYAQQYIPHDKAREKAWSETVHEKATCD
jgi:AbrB family looped-hinge helix DNA binding protein